jgi:hypothetical protein
MAVPASYDPARGRRNVSSFWTYESAIDFPHDPLRPLNRRRNHRLGGEIKYRSHIDFGIDLRTAGGATRLADDPPP